MENSILVIQLFKLERDSGYHETPYPISSVVIGRLLRPTHDFLDFHQNPLNHTAQGFKDRNSNLAFNISLFLHSNLNKIC